jgi:hypothetical protein
LRERGSTKISQTQISQAVPHTQLASLFPYQCDKPGCGKRFAKKEDLVQHRKLKTCLDPFPWKCNNEIYTEINIIRENGEIEKKGEWRRCNEGFRTKQSLLAHKRKTYKSTGNCKGVDRSGLDRACNSNVDFNCRGSINGEILNRGNAKGRTGRNQEETQMTDMGRADVGRTDVGSNMVGNSSHERTDEKSHEGFDAESVESYEAKIFKFERSRQKQK